MLNPPSDNLPLLIFHLTVLLFVFWYCHKRGREERIKKESSAQIVDSEGRIIELEDDPMLAGPSGTQADTVAHEGERPVSSSRHGTRRDERKEREKREKAEKAEATLK